MAEGMERGEGGYDESGSASDVERVELEWFDGHVPGGVGVSLFAGLLGLCDLETSAADEALDAVLLEGMASLDATDGH
jgi:hypothetical protein